jgi:peptide/nickel transport system substrate-binding protein
MGALAAFALMVAACGGGDNDGSSSGGDTSGPTAPTTAPAPSPTLAPTEITSGGTLRYAYYLAPSRFDPHRSTIGQDTRLFMPVYDRLIHYEESGALVPGLATDWTFSEDGLTLTLSLRDNVVFHDGTPFNAEAAKANLERGKTVEGSSVLADLRNIESVSVVDDLTISLQLTSVDAVLPALLSTRAGAIVSPAAFDNEDLDFAPVGAGPYRVTEYRVGDLIIYERFTDHWDPNYGGPDRIEVRILTDETTRLNALRAGEVDIAFITGTQMPEAERAGLTVDSRPTLTYQVMYLNRGKAGLDNPLIRRAFQHAIDRDAYVRVVLNGAGIPNIQPFPPGYFAYNEDFPNNFYEYNPQKARDLLAEAGVENLELELLVPSVRDRIVAGELMQQWFADIGVTLNIRQFESSQAGDIFFAREEGNAMQSQWGGRIDPQMTLDLQHRPEAFLNAGDHTTERYMELSELAKVELDPEARRQILLQMVAEITEQATTLIVASDYIVHAFSDRVNNFGLYAAGGELTFHKIGVTE